MKLSAPVRSAGALRRRGSARLALVVGLAACVAGSARTWIEGAVVLPVAQQAAQQAAGAEELGAADQDLIGRLRRDAAGRGLSVQERGALQQEAFDRFIQRMDSYDGVAAVAVARAMHAHSNAEWSLFCLEGALRRAAPARPDPSSDAGYDEAVRALEAFLATPGLDEAARIRTVQRRAILASGFGRGQDEAAALGNALVSGGVDGAQILGLTALDGGRDAVAAALFGGLLDRRGNDESLWSDAPWALRGHAFASYERLTSTGESD